MDTLCSPPHASTPSTPDYDVAQLGQVFTPEPVVRAMLALRRNHGRTLEPSCGNGAFLRHLPGAVGIELDPRHAPPGVLVGDFFALPLNETFDTIIGNPPYVRHQDIAPGTRRLLPTELPFDRRSNLFLYFIAKCVKHLVPGGELIFITPRDFLKATSAQPLNRLLHARGTITHAIELGDKKSFAGALPNCLIWRFVEGDFSRRTALIDAAHHRTLDDALAAARNGDWEMRDFVEHAGQLAFVRDAHEVPLTEVFSVKVGAVSGADSVFASAEHGTRDFVCSHTRTSGETRRMIWQPESPHPALQPHKAALLARRIAPFDESNWWQWGRGYPQSAAPRIYVNHRTRVAEPFFLHDSPHFDGAVLALFPHRPDVGLNELCAMLNAVDWAEQGFVCDGRFIFGQRALQNARLPAAFAAYARQLPPVGSRAA
ncbi:Eco57I restriction-modification methylase domain-containing protein [Niveibacterium umoris]|uniref:site-specific DNA-methyltransferase (adenine-specific) n=1 Tax=Niveibacterium umoris TaxID=1193620 RepID=A0A840BJU7_9RHOO|nr:class I SAM-dependent methyltransferase [Niveibacterium umoris]MBB4013240.1 adenine-specific DNA-methyltransferase [Niveibacterium umoris]